MGFPLWEETHELLNNIGVSVGPTPSTWLSLWELQETSNFSRSHFSQSHPPPMPLAYNPAGLQNTIFFQLLQHILWAWVDLVINGSLCCIPDFQSWKKFPIHTLYWIEFPKLFLSLTNYPFQPSNGCEKTHSCSFKRITISYNLSKNHTDFLWSPKRTQPMHKTNASTIWWSALTPLDTLLLFSNQLLHSFLQSQPFLISLKWNCFMAKFGL